MTTGPTTAATKSYVEAIKDVFSKNNVAEFNKQSLLFEQALKCLGAYFAKIQQDTSFYENESRVRQIGKVGFRDVDGERKYLPYVSNIEYIDYRTELADFYLDKQGRSFKNYFNLTPDKIAHMSHYMYVTEELISSKSGKRTEKVILNNKNNLDGLILNPTSGRRGGAGVQSININYEGIDSETKRIVVVNAKYVFQDTNEMLSDPYIGLFLLDTKKEVRGENYRRTINFNIGWDTNQPEKVGVNFEKLKLSLRTNLVNYSINLNQDGSVIVDATYRGSFIETLSSPSANILEYSKARASEVRNNTEEIAKNSAKIADNSGKVAKRLRAVIFFLEEFRRQTALFISRPSTTSLGGTTSGLTSATVTDFADFSQTIFGSYNTLGVTAGGGGYTPAPWTLAVERLFDRGKGNFLRTLGIDSVPQKALFNKRLKQEYETLKQTVFDRVISETIRDEATQGEFLAVQLEETAKVINDLRSKLDVESGKAMDATGAAAAQAAKEANLARLSALREIGKNLIEDSKVYYVIVPTAAVENYKFQAHSGNQISATGIAQNAPIVHIGSLDEFKEFNTEKNFTDSIDLEDHQITPFVFFGDVIKSVLERIPASIAGGAGNEVAKFVIDLINETGGDIRVDFGYISYNTPYSNLPIRGFPIYYLPVSLVELNNFFNREVVSKGLSYYSVSDFITDMCKKFLAGAFEQCSKDSMTQGFIPPKISILNTTTRDSAVLAKKVEKEVSTSKGKGKAKKVEIDFTEARKYLSKTTKTPVDNVFIYGTKETVFDLTAKGLLSTARGPNQPFGNFVANMRRGVPHFYFLGVDRGIEKNISLTDIADQSVKTAVYYSSKSSLVTSGLNTNRLYKKTGIPPAVFQAEIDSLGFPLFNIGQLIYIDLIDYNKGKGKDATRMLKASGYYSIYKVSHEITAETFSSKVTAIIQVPYEDREEIITEAQRTDVKVDRKELAAERKRVGLTTKLVKTREAEEDSQLGYKGLKESELFRTTEEDISKIKSSTEFTTVMDQRKAALQETKDKIQNYKDTYGKSGASGSEAREFRAEKRRLEKEYKDDSSKIEEELNKWIIKKLK